MNDWTKHDNSEPPALAPAAMVEVIDNYGDDFGPDRVDSFCWGYISHYRAFTDPEGAPYTSADGLEPWAEYVATDDVSDAGRDGAVCQFAFRPLAGGGQWNPDRAITGAPETHRHPGDWRESLYRVWRDE